MLDRNRFLSSNNDYYSVPLSLILFLMGIIIVHSTSRQVFSFLTDMNMGFIICFFFSLANFVYWDSAAEEKRIWLGYKMKVNR